MKGNAIYLGLDVHKDSIAACVLPADERDPRPVVTLQNRPEDLRRLVGRLKREGEVYACYEAGACGYEVHRTLTSAGVRCDVVAPALIPVRAGDRVKTDRRDAEKMARLLRAGELVAIRVPTEPEEALRDLARCHEDLREDVLRERHRLLKFLLRHGRVFTDGKNWTMAHWAWLHGQQFADPTLQAVFVEYLSRLDSTLGRRTGLERALAEAGGQTAFRDPVARLRCLRGIDTLSAVTLVAEICDFRRFGHPRELMAFVGLVPSERSSGGKQRRGSITKTGNAHARRVLVEAAWHYRHPPRRTKTMLARWEGQPPQVVDHAWKAQERLHKRFYRLTSRNKPSQVAAVAVARELCGFVWALANA